MKYVIEFSKTGLSVFTSHLDLMRMFKRAFRRSGIELTYSKGFNPHPRMGLALPLSLGYSGERELIEFRTEKEIDATALPGVLDNALPSGVKPLRAGVIRDSKSSCAASAVAAAYDITLPVEFTDEAASSVMSHFTEETGINVKKITKSGKEKEIDIKPMIRDIEVLSWHGSMLVRCTLDAGSSSNLSPELLISYLISSSFPDMKREDVSVCRKSIDLSVDCVIDWL